MFIYVRARQSQSGAVLIVCLMMLMVMTLLGISSITSTTLEEKMAGNVRNKHLSFQATEAALRAGETTSSGLTNATVYDGTNGLYSRSEPGQSDYPLWEQASGINWQDVSTTSAGVTVEPQYILEYFGSAPRDENCPLDPSQAATCYLPIYRVTAQGWGLNTNAQTILQSTYKKSF
jgi:type IV pilus assembly protein PilX